MLVEITLLTVLETVSTIATMSSLVTLSIFQCVNDDRLERIEKHLHLPPFYQSRQNNSTTVHVGQPMM
jgi:hypothetical protein